MKNTPCDHTVAMQGDTLLTIGTLPNRIKDEVYGWNSYEQKICAVNGKTPKIVKPLDFLDGRKGYMNLFCYCHSCGKKIDWKMIKEMIGNI